VRHRYDTIFAHILGQRLLVVDIKFTPGHRDKQQRVPPRRCRDDYGIQSLDLQQFVIVQESPQLTILKFGNPFGRGL